MKLKNMISPGHLSLIIILGSLLISCDTRHKNVCLSEVGSVERLFGYKNSKYTIGNEYPGLKEHFDSTFVHLRMNQNYLTGISVSNTTKYELSNGIRIGTPKDDVIELLGKPLHYEVPLTKSGYQIGAVPALVYKNLFFWLDENQQVAEIILQVNVAHSSL